MNIAVAADGENLDSEVSEKFEQCLYLLIINIDDLDDVSITVIKNDQLQTNSSVEDLAKEVLKYDCEAVITGTMNSVAFGIFSEAGVTKLMGFDCLVKESLKLMNRGY